MYVTSGGRDEVANFTPVPGFGLHREAAPAGMVWPLFWRLLPVVPAGNFRHTHRRGVSESNMQKRFKLWTVAQKLRYPVKILEFGPFAKKFNGFCAIVRFRSIWRSDNGPRAMVQVWESERIFARK